jgi:hypothetical protein
MSSVDCRIGGSFVSTSKRVCQSMGISSMTCFLDQIDIVTCTRKLHFLVLSRHEPRAGGGLRRHAPRTSPTKPSHLHVPASLQLRLLNTPRARERRSQVTAVRLHFLLAWQWRCWVSYWINQHLRLTIKRSKPSVLLGTISILDPSREISASYTR